MPATRGGCQGKRERETTATGSASGGGGRGVNGAPLRAREWGVLDEGMVDGGWTVEGGGWRVEGGGWRVQGWGRAKGGGGGLNEAVVAGRLEGRVEG